MMCTVSVKDVRIKHARRKKKQKTECLPSVPFVTFNWCVCVCVFVFAPFGKEKT